MEVITADTKEYVEKVEMESAVSFRPFINFLKEKNAAADAVHTKFFRFIIKKFEARPDLLNAFTNLSKLDDAAELIELLKSAIFPLAGDEHKQRIALSVPFKFGIFYATEVFRNTFYNESGNLYIPPTVSVEQLQKDKMRSIYKEILHRFYNITLTESDDIIYPIADQKSGLIRYYKISIDKRFVDIKFTGNYLPDIKKNVVCSKTLTILDIDELLHLLPLEQFSLEGFAIWHVEDITQERALSDIKNTILSAYQRDDNSNYQLLEKSINSLIGNSDIEVAILPVIKINERIVFEDVINSGRSLLLKSLSSFSTLQKSYNDVLNECGEELQPLIFVSIGDEDIKEYPFLGPMHNSGYLSYVCYPIIGNNGLLGVMELASKKEATLDHTFYSKLEPAFPLLAQGLDGYRERFNERLQKIIREKFTSVQPAVEWKFNEQAWNYLRKSINGEEPEIDNIAFNDVSPLYGAVDIRNSSVERNYAIKKDITEQLSLIADTLSLLQKHVQLPVLEELEFKNESLLQSLHDELSPEEELKLNDFIDHEIEPLFNHLRYMDNTINKQVYDYFNAVNENHGHIYHHRREYEESLDAINKAVSNYLESEKEMIQHAYPSYFEKYRTDGVEYNIYIGQSIAPNKPFDAVYLRNLRLWQLRSMAEIAQLTHKLLRKLKVPLQTTQLILIHSKPIDISFRRDERKFDVEGAYNIRYEMIKKRIDKVHIYNSEERLTQPGKVALVYTNPKEAEEYLQYIKFLQNKNLLLDNLEHLDLEELQGVLGLKAIRVGVNYEV
jgi:hypothetical protein